MNLQQPTISIITVCYNAAGSLERTIVSVLGQNYGAKELVIVDGGSTDGTLTILEKYKKQITYISEPDTGIYNAMNKAIKLCKGQIIGTLGAGDFYLNNQALNQIANTFTKNKTTAVYADIQMVKPNNIDKIVRFWKAGPYKISNWLNGWMPPHLTFFVVKSAFENHGYYNETFRSAGDYELMLRFLYKHKLTASYLPIRLVTMPIGGASSGSFKNRLKANREDKLAWTINNLEPRPYTLIMKPLSKIFQFLKK